VSAQIQYGPAHRSTSAETPPPAITRAAETSGPASQDECHFTTAIRFGRRKTDQVGHFTLTSLWLKFHGTVDLRIAWGEVARVEQAGAEIIVSLHGTRRTLRFCCSSDEEAARGAAIGAHLAGSARCDRFQSV
jgi:hypothetical protein